MSIEVYTDGSCDKGNGGYAVIIKLSGGEEVELTGGAFNTTSTQMELTAVLSAINYLDVHHNGVAAKISADYKTIADNLSSGQTLEEMQISSDRDMPLWEELMDAIDGRAHFDFQWVKGHNGHPDNVRVDKLAQLARKRFLLSQKPKCFVYYNSLLKATDRCFMVDQTVSMMVKQEGQKHVKMRTDELGVCHEDKDFIELRAFERAMRYTVEVMPRISQKKVIMFCNMKSIVLTLKDINRGRIVLGRDATSLLWKSILEFMDEFDIEVYTAGRSKLDFFDLDVDEHISNQERVREVVVAA